MNVNTAGDDKLAPGDKLDEHEFDHGHEHNEGNEKHHHVEEEDCTLETDTRTVYLD